MNITVQEVKQLSVSVFLLLLLATAILELRPIQAADSAAADGAAIYKARCASCHGADGSGSTALGKKMKLRSLKGLSEAHVSEITANGKGKMPAYKKSLGIDGVKAVSMFVARELR